MIIPLYLISAVSLITAMLALYFLFTRNNDYINIVDHYAEQIKKLEKKTTDTMEKIAAEAEYIAIETIEKIASKTQIKEIKKELQTITDQLKNFRSENEQLQKIISEKDRVIHEKDAILQRKEKQLKRLKNEI